MAVSIMAAWGHVQKIEQLCDFGRSASDCAKSRRCKGLRHRSTGPLFDHVVGERDECRRYVEIERLGGLEVQGKPKQRRLFERQFCGLGAFENAIDKSSHAGKALIQVG